MRYCAFTLLVTLFAGGCSTMHRVRAPYPQADQTVRCLLHCDSDDAACVRACPGVREEVGECEGLPPPCVERREAHVAATLLLVGAIVGGFVWAFVQVGSEFSDTFH